MLEKRPIIISVIGYYNMLGVFLLILSLFTMVGASRITVYLLPFYLNASILLKILLIAIDAIILLIISYAYLKLKPWGYWLTICYNILILIGWIITFWQNKLPYFTQSITPIIIQLIFTIPTIRYFKKQIVEK